MQVRERWPELVEGAHIVTEGLVEAWRARGQFGPLPPGFPEPTAVQTLRWLRTPISLLERGRARYGEVFTLRLLGADPFVLFSDPEAVRDIFTGPPETLFAGQANAVLEPILGSHSVILLDGPRHLRQRRLLLPPFHGQRMRAYGETMREVTLRSMADWPRGRPFAVHDFTQKITLEVILRTVFGMEGRDDRDEIGRALVELLDCVADPAILVPALRVDLGPRSPGGRMKRRLAVVDRLLYALIARVRAEPDPSREDVLSLLIQARDEDGAPMSDAELRDELVTLLLAGHETTATSLAWAMHRLIDSPEAQRRAHEEIDRAFPEGPVDTDEVRALPWLKAVIDESLRLNPVVPLVGRRLQEPMRFAGLELPAGVIAVPAIYLVHRNPRVWPDPDRFSPERFLDTRVSPYEHFPFGGGIRRCIGMAFAIYEMQVVLATVLKRLSLHPAPGYRAKVVRRSITFAPSEGMPLIVRDR